MGIDWSILNAIQGLRSPVGDAIIPAISFLGAAGWIWIALGIVLGFKAILACGGEEESE